MKLNILNSAVCALVLYIAPQLTHAASRSKNDSFYDQVLLFHVKAVADPTKDGVSKLCHTALNGEEKDRAKAITELHKLVESEEDGSSIAAYSLGVFYLTGKFVKQDERVAAKFLEIASNKKNPFAMNLLGQMLENGRGVFLMRTLMDKVEFEMGASGAQVALWLDLNK